MRTYVVTGSRSGIGAATADRLLRQGHRVIGVDRSRADVTADLATAEGRAAMVRGVTALSGGAVDAVVACAGVGGAVAGVVEVNYFGAVATLDGLRPLLQRSSAPRAVAVASIGVTAAVDASIVDACLAGDEDAARAAAAQSDRAYTSRKRALARWIRRSAPSAAWAGAGITLNAVGPGLVATPMTQGYLGDPAMSASLRDSMPMPLGWPSTPEQIAPVLDWLSSAVNTVVTGQVLFADGGLDAARHGDDIW
jgi:NAD(P)-dependent dehydrogenase (short-subunit alcohol dehydrogenase family)